MDAPAPEFRRAVHCCACNRLIAVPELAGTGFDVEMRVDPVELHVVGDIPFLGQLLAGPVMSGVQGILQQTFHKQLPKE